MSAGCRAGTTAQDVLVAHEFTVVLAKCAGNSAVAGEGRVGAACPFPNVAEHLNQVLMLLWSFRWDSGRYSNEGWMKQFSLDEIAFDWTIQRRALPFELSREARPSPVGIRVSFEIADVRDRLGLIDTAQTGECEIPPRPGVFCPVKRRVPTLFVHSHPAER